MLKYKPHYDLQGKMPWHSDFMPSHTHKLSLLQLKGKSAKLLIPKMKLNKIDARFTSKFYHNMFREFRESHRFLKLFCLSILESLIFGPSQNGFPISLLNCLVMVTKNKLKYQCLLTKLCITFAFNRVHFQGKF